jgi:hypothetical protein
MSISFSAGLMPVALALSPRSKPRRRLPARFTKRVERGRFFSGTSRLHAYRSILPAAPPIPTIR